MSLSWAQQLPRILAVIKYGNVVQRRDARNKLFHMARAADKGEPMETTIEPLARPKPITLTVEQYDFVTPGCLAQAHAGCLGFSKFYNGVNRRCECKCHQRPKPKGRPKGVKNKKPSPR